VNEESLLNGLLDLSTLLNVLAGTLCGTTKHKLGLELPLLGDVPVTLCLLVNDGVVVLEVASTAFSLKSSPEVVLRHGGRLSSPTREMVSIQSKLLLKFSDRLRINKEQNLDHQYDQQLRLQKQMSSFKHTVPWPALKPSSFFSVAGNASSGI
jgi:hypothetical protein